MVLLKLKDVSPKKGKGNTPKRLNAFFKGDGRDCLKRGRIASM